MAKRYALVPGFARSAHDSDWHYVSCQALIRAYGVNPRECFTVRHDADLRTLPKDVILLCPRCNGDYDIPQSSDHHDRNCAANVLADSARECERHAKRRETEEVAKMTKKTVREQGAIYLLDQMVGISPDETAERIGRLEQKTMATACQFPLDMRERREVYEKLGFRFGKQIDDVLIKAQLPSGWTIEPCEHYMYSNILDDKGRERGHIFFKPEFYDRHAEVTLVTRYIFGVWPDYQWVKEHESEYGSIREMNLDQPHTAIVKDFDGTLLWTTYPITERESELSGYKFRNNLLQMAKDWIDEHYPDHENPLAYWDD